MPKKQEKRADGRYSVYISLGRDPETGKRLRKAFYGETQREANAKKNAYLKQQESPVSNKPMTVAEWADQWLAVYASGGTSNRASTDLYVRKLKDAIGHKEIKDIKRIDIQMIANDIADQSKSGVAKYRSVINRVFAEAQASNLILQNPVTGVKWQHAGEGTHRALEQWERDLIRENWAVHRTGIWAMLMLYAGLRRGEALALKWENVDLKALELRVCEAVKFFGNQTELGDPKSRAALRTIPIMPPLEACLCSIDSSKSDTVCYTAAKGPMTESAFKRGWESWLNAMENILNGEPPIQPGKRTDKPKLNEKGDPIKRKTFSVRAHDLRHTFCTMLYEANVDIKTAMYLMGHEDEKMTMKIYTHLSEKKKTISVDALRAYLT